MQMGQEKACDLDKKNPEKVESVSLPQSPAGLEYENFRFGSSLFILLFCLSFFTFKVPSAGRIRCAATAAAPVGKPRFEMLRTFTKQLESKI